MIGSNNIGIAHGVIVERSIQMVIDTPIASIFSICASWLMIQKRQAHIHAIWYKPKIMWY